MDLASGLWCLREARRLAAAPAARWPGWDFDAHPIALAVAEGTVLWRHPSPPAGFAPLRGALAGPPGPLHLGPTPGGLANTAVEWGGVEVATVSLAGEAPGPEAARLIVHEAFHAFQRRVRPGSGVPSHWTPAYPEDDAANNALARAENEALAAFLGGALDAGRCARDVAALRTVRYACLAERWADYEAAAEWCEGGATLAEVLAAGGRPAAGPLAAQLQRANRGGDGAAYRRFYASGAAVGLVLENLLPDWRARWLAPGASPTVLLHEAAGGVADPDAALARWRCADLLREEARATQERRRETAALLASLTPAVEIDVSAAPATRFGFDPTRQRGLGGGRLWHGGPTRLEGRGWIFWAEGQVLEDRAAGRIVVRWQGVPASPAAAGPLELPFLRATRARVQPCGAGWRITVEPGEA